VAGVTGARAGGARHAAHRAHCGHAAGAGGGRGCTLLRVLRARAVVVSARPARRFGLRSTYVEYVLVTQGRGGHPSKHRGWRADMGWLVAGSWLSRWWSVARPPLQLGRQAAGTATHSWGAPSAPGHTCCSPSFYRHDKNRRQHEQKCRGISATAPAAARCSGRCRSRCARRGWGWRRRWSGSCQRDTQLRSLHRGGCPNRWHSLVNCDHGDSITRGGGQAAAGVTHSSGGHSCR
jgi:hypothetical protein